jgi:hypothetical protein
VPRHHAALGGPRAPRTESSAASAARASSRLVTAPTGRSRPSQAGHRSASTSNTFASNRAHATRYRYVDVFVGEAVAGDRVSVNCAAQALGSGVRGLQVELLDAAAS